MRRLFAAGFVVGGWDPVHRPDGARVPADLVNLGYVVNVVEDPAERAQTLMAAWELARNVLVVAAQLEGDDGGGSVPHGDGCLTRLQTFQKYYRQSELGEWIRETTGRHPVALAPGVFAVFRQDMAQETFLLARIRRSPRRILPDPRTLFDQHADVLSPVLDFMVARGRSPQSGELPTEAAVIDRLGSLRQACRVVERAFGAESWQEAREARMADLLVFLALQSLRGKPQPAQLPVDVQADVRGLFGTLRVALHQASSVLQAAADVDLRDFAMENAAFGKRTGNALYVHASAVDDLAPILRVVEGCARRLSGELEGVTLVKLHRDKPRVSYLSYPDFDRVAHPVLAWSWIVDLARLSLEFRDYRETENPPLLHRKEEFVPIGYPGRDKFERLTRQEERRGLLADTAHIGTLVEWERVLATHAVRVAGHRVVSVGH